MNSIYYLGGKLNLLNPIVETVSAINGSQGTVIDLFSGSGVVSRGLAAESPVLSNDIQEYARILTSAQTTQHTFSNRELNEILDEAKNLVNSSPLFNVFEPLIYHERKSIDKALKGAPYDLCQLIESPTVKVAQDYAYEGIHILEAHKEVINNLAACSKSNLELYEKSLITRYFGGLYFSVEQAIVLDTLINYASSKDSQISDTLKSIVLSSATSVVNTVGQHFAQPIQPRDKQGGIKSSMIKKSIQDRAKCVFKAFESRLLALASYIPPLNSCEAHAKHYIELLSNLETDISVIYADPPYTRDHYSRFYHVLETLSLYDEPNITLIYDKKFSCRRPTRALYRETRHQSPFSIKNKAPEAFALLFEQAKRLKSSVVLSYSPHEANDGTHPRAISLSQLQDIGNMYFRSVRTVLHNSIKHSSLNRKSLHLKNREHAEIIMTLRN